jgi:predicted Zn-dependent protease
MGCEEAIMIRRRLSLICVVFGLLLPIFAQRRGSTGGSNTPRTTEVTVRVTFPNDHPADRGLDVSLVAPGGGTVQQAFTDDMGSAAFHGITPGIYRVRVSGVDVETAEVGQFEVTGLEPSQYEYVHIKPKDDNTNAGVGGGMISAADLNIPEKAKKEFDKGLECLKKPGEEQQALEHFEKATVIYPQYSNAYNNIGFLEIKSGNRVQARQAFETAVSLNPKSATGYLNLARMSLEEKNYAEADKSVSKALSAEPNRVDAVALAAQTKLMEGDLDGAYAYAHKVHDMGDHKQYAMVHLICARVMEQRHEPEKAMEEYKTFLTESPNSPSAPQVREAVARLGGTVAAAK